MKAKLLRKLRKRFHWYREEGRGCWSLYDKKTKTDSYVYIMGFYYINDMLQYTMLQRMDKLKWFRKLRDRK